MADTQETGSAAGLGAFVASVRSGSRGATVSVDIGDKSFRREGGALQPVLARLQLAVRSEEILCIVGPSGCGKTTLLKIIAGLDRRYVGTVTIDGSRVSAPTRACGVMFQESRLFPWMNARKNVRFALPASMAGREQDRMADAALSSVGLSGAASVLPKDMSGGMERRVALARAIVTTPRLILLDEPYSALDLVTKRTLQDNLLSVQAQLGLTIILVTHDIEEAVYMGDRVLVLAPEPGPVAAEVAIKAPRPRDRTDAVLLATIHSLANRVSCEWR